MIENKNSDLGPLEGGEGTKKYPLRKVCVKIYLNEKEFSEWIQQAENTGIRPRGLKPFRLRPHGFSHERIANTKGLVKFVKDVVLPFWKKGEAQRKERRAKLEAEALELGLVVKEA